MDFNLKLMDPLKGDIPCPGIWINRAGDDAKPLSGTDSRIFSRSCRL